MKAGNVLAFLIFGFVPNSVFASTGELPLKQAAVNDFIKQAHDPKSVLHKSLVSNEEFIPASAENSPDRSHTAEASQLQPADLNVTVLYAVDSALGEWSAVVGDESLCRSDLSSATYLVSLMSYGTLNMQQVTVNQAVAYTVSVNRYEYLKKPNPKVACADLRDAPNLPKAIERILVGEFQEASLGSLIDKK